MFSLLAATGASRTLSTTRSNRLKLPQFILSATSNLSLYAPRFCRPTLAPALKALGLIHTACLLEFATDFEIAYNDDCWDNVSLHFTEGAIYEIKNTSFACRLEGRDAIIAGFKKSLNGFDRHLTRRMWVVEGPYETSAKLSFVWHGVYSATGIPPLELSARQTLNFNGKKITHLTDDYLPGYGESARRWIEDHRPDLNPAYA